MPARALRRRDHLRSLEDGHSLAPGPATARTRAPMPRPVPRAPAGRVPERAHEVPARARVPPASARGTAPLSARRVIVEADQPTLAPGFSTQTLHQPAAATSLPGKMLQGPAAEPALPVYCMQFAQCWPGL